MTVDMDALGRLVVKPESMAEEFALRWWEGAFSSGDKFADHPGLLIQTCFDEEGKRPA